MSKAVRFGFQFPASKAALDREVRASQLLSSLWHKSNLLPTLNCPQSLPMDIKTKAELNTEIASANPNKVGMVLKLKQTVGYGKMLINFYKKGLSNVWNNQLMVWKLQKSEFKLHQLDARGDDVQVRIPGFRKLTEEMSLAIYMSTVENKAANEYVSGEVKRTDVVPKIVNEGLFNLTRSQYQLIRRTPIDFLKLPTFAIIVMIFMECTPFLCYAVPEITPLTCVLPAMLTRMWPQSQVSQLTEKESEETSIKNAYNLPISDVRQLCRSLRLVSKYIPTLLVPQSVLCHRLQNYYQYLKVDNYYLSGLNGGGNVWDLLQAELLQAALERNLVPDLKKVVAEHEKITDEAIRKKKEHEYTEMLRLKLFQFIVDFEIANVGYLLIAPQINNYSQLETVYRWWKQDHRT